LRNLAKLFVLGFSEHWTICRKPFFCNHIHISYIQYYNIIYNIQYNIYRFYNIIYIGSPWLQSNEENFHPIHVRLASAGRPEENPLVHHGTGWCTPSEMFVGL
jgi:hypothetical protein